MSRNLWILVITFFVASPAAGIELPVAGKKLRIGAGAARRMSAVLEDPAIAAPFSDPAGGARLVVSGGAGPGQCFAQIPLPAEGWAPIRGDGVGRGWRYRGSGSESQGVRRIVVREGRIRTAARGALWPCELTAAAQRTPFRLELRLGDARYCAEFADPEVNAPGRFVAAGSPAPVACPKQDLTVANLNLLHGLFCGAGSCRQADRVDLFYQWVAGDGCPDVVTVQEVWDPMVPLLAAQLATVCPFTYEQGYVRSNGIDDAMVLSRYPIATQSVTLLYKGFRHVLHARIDHPLGPTDVFTTHLASGGDGAGNPCAGDCPVACVTAGAATVRQCQAVQVALLVEATHDVETPAILSGDLNAEPGEFEVSQMTARGWIDSHLAAGNPECDPPSGVGCTSGRADDLAELESTAVNVDERIDYIFVVPPSLGACALDGPADADGDGVATGTFADEPNPFSPSCGAAPDPICWPSDHDGCLADLNCG